jgi:hypothetical protein
MRAIRNAYQISVGRHEGLKPLGKFRRRWEDNIKMYIMEIAFEVVNLSE